jgi:hypothetical protein
MDSSWSVRLSNYRLQITQKQKLFGYDIFPQDISFIKDLMARFANGILIVNITHSFVTFQDKVNAEKESTWRLDPALSKEIKLEFCEGESVTKIQVDLTRINEPLVDSDTPLMFFTRFKCTSVVQILLFHPHIAQKNLKHAM